MIPSGTSPAPDFQHEIERLVERTAGARHVHSLVLGVRTDDGQIDVRAAAGAAEPGDRYFIASISKMFTAAMVMQLVDERRLDLDDPIRDHLPEIDLAGIHTHRGTDHTDRLEIRHLLHQTSGLPDYFAGDLQTDLENNRDRSYDLDDVLEIARRRPAKFPPSDRNGTRSSYSDTNYQLLSTIIEHASGVSLAANLQTRIAAPLGLADTYLYGPETSEQLAEPLPLHHRDRRLSLPLVLASERGAGGIVSTVADQLRFLQAFDTGELFQPANLARMQRFNRIFFPLEYGYGLMRYRLPRIMTPFRAAPTFIGHSGVVGSFSFSVPDAGLHIAGTFNQLDKPSRPFGFMLKVAKLAAAHQRRIPGR